MCRAHLHSQHVKNPGLRAGSDYSYVGVYGKWGQPPGWSYGQSDFRSNGGYFPGNQLAYELKFDASMPGFQTGEPQLLIEGPQMWRGPGCQYGQQWF